MSRWLERGDHRALAEILAADGIFYVLMLFVSGTTPNSARAIAHTRAMCEALLADRHALTIVDIYQHPELAVLEQIIAVPTLLRKGPQPVKRLVGDMAGAEHILLAHHLAAFGAPGSGGAPT